MNEPPQRQSPGHYEVITADGTLYEGNNAPLAWKTYSQAKLDAPGRLELRRDGETVAALGSTSSQIGQRKP